MSLNTSSDDMAAALKVNVKDICDGQWVWWSMCDSTMPAKPHHLFYVEVLFWSLLLLLIQLNLGHCHSG